MELSCSCLVCLLGNTAGDDSLGELLLVKLGEVAAMLVAEDLEGVALVHVAAGVRRHLPQCTESHTQRRRLVLGDLLRAPGQSPGDVAPNRPTRPRERSVVGVPSAAYVNPEADDAVRAASEDPA